VGNGGRLRVFARKAGMAGWVNIELAINNWPAGPDLAARHAVRNCLGLILLVSNKPIMFDSEEERIALREVVCR
jgi:hypothetical protein